MILVSSCLLGLCCRYDGKEKVDERVLTYLKGKNYLPICPEQMGGLPTPRKPAEIVSLEPLKITTEDHIDVTEAFEKGVSEVLKLIKLHDVDEAILKSKSPTCGRYNIYDGTFTRTLIKGSGILAGLLISKNIEVINEEDLA
jgi:uncharacterized protein YbbK (DUF523 family)